MYISRLLNKFYDIGNGLFVVMDKIVDLFFLTTISDFLENNPNIDNAITIIPDFLFEFTLFEFCLGTFLPLYVIVSVVKFFIGIFT